MRIWKMLGLGFLIATLWVTPGWTQPGGRMHGDMLGFGPILRTLSLTDDQKTQVHDAFATYRATVQSHREDLRTTRQQLQDVLLNPKGLDTTALQTVQQNLAGVQADLLQARLTLAQAIRGVLTMDQLTQAAQIIQQLRALRAERHQLLTPPTQP
jgi:Spy/CpxP family protein refolding chaperone